MTIRLEYIGRGGALYDVPARDLTDEDFAERAQIWRELKIDEAALIKSGLYKKFPNKSVIDFIEDEEKTQEETKAPQKGKAKKDGK